MSHLEKVTPEQMPEVLNTATRLWDADQEAAQEQRSAVDAAAELDIPKEYLERAAAQVRTQKVLAIVRARSRRRAAIIAATLVILFSSGWAATHRPPPPPVTYSFNAASGMDWGLNLSPGANATLTFPQAAGHGAVADITVGPGRTIPGSDYLVNLDTHDTPKNLSGYKTLSFTASGAGLSHIRVALENGNDRWRSMVLPLNPQWTPYRLSINQFDHQERSSATASWHTDGTGAPSSAGRLSFKLGQFVNDPNATGDVKIDNIRFE